jgi:hypothetical protein
MSWRSLCGRSKRKAAKSRQSERCPSMEVQQRTVLGLVVDVAVEWGLDEGAEEVLERCDTASELRLTRAGNGTIHDLDLRKNKILRSADPHPLLKVRRHNSEAIN